ncbi:glycosyltransferase family 2 protein [Accumulibacter sp.]|jgi:GT2 family glycosyltransferase|uniref:Glycosyl transferase family 2 n=1 Tax=Accumulibacter regalis TaxID=522306 RepID=C7RNQ3_ACCRE|nr:glycosyltransferase family 2 protein [Accumulibacter sp.]MBN8498372.1 glycosyltransferase family 2 protein [Accumulibacter sp.]MBO3714190.1 glycosyltransferase family 2 protein [Accumulibacter sp.]
MSSIIGRSDSPRVWVVLVNWNGWRDTIECLESVFRLDYANLRVLVCDNASADASIENIRRWAGGEMPFERPQCPLARLSWPPISKPVSCHVLRADEILDTSGTESSLVLVGTGGNLGFAAGNNVGIRIALSDPDCAFVWLLNNDTVVEADCLAQMVSTAISDPSIGVTGSLNCYYSRPEIVQALGGGWFKYRTVRGGLYGHEIRRSELTPTLIRKAESSLDWVSGSSMLVSRNFLEQVGSMEERYFLYYEEIDWAQRSQGRFIHAFAHAAVLYHKAGSATQEQCESEFAIFTLYRARFRLYRTFFPSWRPGCHLRTLFECAFALIKGRRVRAKAIFAACVDDLRNSDCKGT